MHRQDRKELKETWDSGLVLSRLLPSKEVDKRNEKKMQYKRPWSHTRH